MTTQKVYFDRVAQNEILAGAEVLADAVKSTMGPSGHSVIIDQGNEKPPFITKDGVTVARSINLKKKLPAIGSNLLKEVASKTNEVAGDGTTTATCLGHAMLSSGTKMIATGRSSIELKQGMDFGTKMVLQFLKQMARHVEDEKDIFNVATISANGDTELGKLIAEAIMEVGKDGIVTIELAKSINTVLEVVNGLQINTGYISPFFITNSDKAIAEFLDPLILITANKISGVSDLLPALEVAHKQDRPLFIIADDVEGEALHACIVNKSKGVLPICAVKAPSYGEHRADVLADIAKVVGAEVIGASSANKLDKLAEEQLGTCQKIICTRKATTFIGAPDDTRMVKDTDELIETLRNVLQNDKTLDDLRISRYRERLARLSGGVAVIRVGGSTEVEILEKKDRVEDAVNATLAAVQEGIVPGGGTALWRAANFLKELTSTTQEGFTDDAYAGISIIEKACRQPMATIIRNTGKSFEVVQDKLLNEVPAPAGKVLYEDQLQIPSKDRMKEIIAGKPSVKPYAKKEYLTALDKLFTSDPSAPGGGLRLDEEPVDFPKLTTENFNRFRRHATGDKTEIPPGTIEYQDFYKRFDDLIASATFTFKHGYNAKDHKSGNMIEMGIVDPVKVTRCALEYATSVVGLMLTCNAIIVNEDEEEDRL